MVLELNQVSTIEGLSVQEFNKAYLKPKVPVIIKDFIKPESPAFQKWNYEYFKSLAGQHSVQVFGKEESSMDKAASAPIDKMTLGEYLDLIQKEPTEKRLFLFNLMKLKPELMHDVEYNDVTGGKVLQWLPYMFFGGEGSSTRNHFDIDMSHVFISQFEGIKRIWLFPNQDSPLLYRLPFNFHGLANLKEYNTHKFPAIQYLKGFEAVIHPGDTLFMPAGWWHFIQYETQGYSVSVRALGSWQERLLGFRNMTIHKSIDDLLRKIFKDKWFDWKIKKAHANANRFIKKFENKR